MCWLRTDEDALTTVLFIEGNAEVVPYACRLGGCVRLVTWG